MILMPQIFDVTANENARYKRNKLEYKIAPSMKSLMSVSMCDNFFIIFIFLCFELNL